MIISGHKSSLNASKLIILRLNTSFQKNKNLQEKQTDFLKNKIKQLL